MPNLIQLCLVSLSLGLGVSAVFVVMELTRRVPVRVAAKSRSNRR
jgi:hypothetical protein